MYFSFNNVVAIVSFIGAVAGHGIITKPWPRTPGVSSSQFSLSPNSSDNKTQFPNSAN